MGLKLEYIKVYPPIEQYCHENDLISEIKVIRDDKNIPHITYTLNGTPDEDPVYDYIKVSNGKIYLTLTGVNAINKDYPDNPDKEISELNFQILAKDIELGDTLIIPVNVGVVRVHAEPPKIVDEIIYDIYQDDAAENERLLDVRTAFPSFFYTTSNLIKIPETDIGRIVLSADGVDFVKNIDFKKPDATTSLDFSITFQDQENNITLIKNYQVPIKPGESLKEIPKKSILEEVGANLGQDLALKIETNTLKIENVNFLNDLVINQELDYATDINTPVFNSFYGKVINDNLFKGIDKDNNKVETLLDNINYVNNNLISNLNKIQQQSINDTINNLNENIYNTLSSEIIDITSTTNNFQFNDIPYLNLIYDSSLNAINYSKNYINDALVLVDKSIHDVANNLDNLIFNLSIDLVNFKHNEYCNFKDETTNRLQELEYLVLNIRKEICGSNDDLFDKGCYTDDDIPIKTRLDDNDKNIQKNADDIEDINKKTLEDWGVDDKWKFTSLTASSGVLSHGGTSILNQSNGVDLYIGTSSFSRLYLDAGGTTAIINSDGLDLGSKKVKADICDCTATKAKYADLAEYYDSDKDYEFGSIISVGGKKEVTVFSKENNNLIGIISDKPGFILNSESNFEIPALIGLKGRIKVKSKEFIKKGSKIYASLDYPGYATMDKNDYLIGYALSDSKNSKNSKKQENGEDFKYLTLIYFKGI